MKVIIQRGKDGTFEKVDSLIYLNASDADEDLKDLRKQGTECKLVTSGSIVCKRCGHVMQESDRSRAFTSLIWCAGRHDTNCKGA